MRIIVGGKERDVKVQEPEEGDLEEFLEIMANLQDLPKLPNGNVDVRGVKSTLQNAKNLMSRLTDIPVEDITHMKMTPLKDFLRGIMSEMMAGPETEKGELLKNSKPPSP